MRDYRLWQYRDDNNCWDFVRTVLHAEFGIPRDAVPKYGICPSDKVAMTEAFKEIKKGFLKVDGPCIGAVACHFEGIYLCHVGVIRSDNLVWNASSARGVSKDSIRFFEKMNRTEYYLWQA